MALKNLFGAGKSVVPCGSACGTGDKIQAAAPCGSACGTGDK